MLHPGAGLRVGFGWQAAIYALTMEPHEYYGDKQHRMIAK